MYTLGQRRKKEKKMSLGSKAPHMNPLLPQQAISCACQIAMNSISTTVRLISSHAAKSFDQRAPEKQKQNPDCNYQVDSAWPTPPHAPAAPLHPFIRPGPIRLG
jgi:ATP adenylyltransferase/5',5'''-P-1,P-4-tetraphosphate phosphorylase II